MEGERRIDEKKTTARLARGKGKLLSRDYELLEVRSGKAVANTGGREERSERGGFPQSNGRSVDFNTEISRLDVAEGTGEREEGENMSLAKDESIIPVLIER